MSKIVVDQVQKSGGAAFTLPTTDGTAGQLMSTNGAGVLSFVALPSNTILPADSANIIGTVMTASARGNIYSTGEWSSSGPNSTYQNATAAGSDPTYTNMSWNMFLADGYPNGTSQIMYANDFRGLEKRTIEYANWNRVGNNYRELFYYENNTSYGGVSWRVLPIRNTTAAPITTTVNFMYSSYDAYNGAACGYYTPNAATYAGASGGTWTQGFTNTSNTITSSSMSVTVPANTTVLVMLITSHNYQTTYYYKESSMFYNLSTTFSTGLVCDLRMLNSLQNARSSANTNSVGNPHQIYNACAATYGNR